MSETVFPKSPDITGQIPPGPTVPFKLINFPDQTLAQPFVLFDSGGNEIGTNNPLPIVVSETGLKQFYHDEEVIDESLAPVTTVITYKLAGITVGTKTITVSGSTTTILVA